MVLWKYRRLKIFERAVLRSTARSHEKRFGLFSDNGALSADGDALAARDRCVWRPTPRPRKRFRPADATLADFRAHQVVATPVIENSEPNFRKGSRLCENAVSGVGGWCERRSRLDCAAWRGHRIFEGHLDSEQSVLVGRFFVRFHRPT